MSLTFRHPPEPSLSCLDSKLTQKKAYYSSFRPHKSKYSGKEGMLEAVFEFSTLGYAYLITRSYLNTTEAPNHDLHPVGNVWLSLISLCFDMKSVIHKRFRTLAARQA